MMQDMISWLGMDIGKAWTYRKLRGSGSAEGRGEIMLFLDAGPAIQKGGGADHSRDVRWLSDL
jgi:hypothetical protein